MRDFDRLVRQVIRRVPEITYREADRIVVGLLTESWDAAGVAVCPRGYVAAVRRYAQVHRQSSG